METKQIHPSTVVYTAVEAGNRTDLLEAVLGDRTPRQYLDELEGRTLRECVQSLADWLQESLNGEGTGWFSSAAKAAEYLAQTHDYPHQYAALRIVGTTARELHELVVDAAEND
jgi:hypothetical protein